MIKEMKTDNASLKLLDNGDIILEVKGHSTVLTVDNLGELCELTEHFWRANDLYRYTSEAMAERKRHGNEWGNPMTLTGMQTPTV